MSLRVRIALGTALLATLAAAMHVAIGYYSFSRLIQEDVARDLAIWTPAIAGAIEIKDGFPRLDSENWGWISSGLALGFRVRKGGRVYLEGGTLPEGTSRDWAYTTTPLAEGYVLELAMYIGEYRKALSGQLRASLFSLPLVMVLAAFFGWIFAGHIARPITRLARAADALSRMQFPDPVPSPPGGGEIADLAQSFNRMVGSVRDAFERERAFTRYASHELRTPLATAQAQIEALEAGLLPQETAIPASKRALKRMHQILEGLLALSREPKARLEAVPAGALLRQLHAGLPEVTRSRVQLDLPEDEVWVLGDEELIARVIGNLVDNALKHTDARVELSLAVEGDRGVLSVRDHGPGVSEDQLARLTDPFVRFNTATEGMGLGLALAHQAAKVMGGELVIRLADPGLRAELRLPIAEVGDA